MSQRVASKERYFDALLPHISVLTQDIACLVEPAQKAALDPRYLTIYFPNGIKDFLSDLQHAMDKRMMAAYQAHLSPEQGIFGKIWICLTQRFLLMAPHKRLYQQINGLKNHLPYLSLCTQLLYKTVDKIWYLAGDQATDHNYYTKRFSLYYVYVRTFSYWLALPDDSNLTLAFDYMKARFQETKKLAQLKGCFDNVRPFAKDSTHKEGS